MSAPVVFAIDPPWKFGDALPGASRGASKNYACMTPDAIARYLAMSMPPADNAVMFMWRVSSMQREALDIIEALSFTQKSELVWRKLTNPKTNPPPCATCQRPHETEHFGMGRYTRQSHETCLIAVRGRAFPTFKGQRSTFAAPIGAHSQKPDRFYRIVERMYPDSAKHEFFARVVRPGWIQSGLELGTIAATENA